MNQIKIGKFIAECRKAVKLTQAQLAEKLGVTDRAVSKWETGRAMPDSSIMLDLCRELKISVNELLNGEKIIMENNEQKNEQLFSKDTDEYYFWLNKNMYELIAFAGHKLAQAIFYDRSLSVKEKAQKAIAYGKMMIRCFDETEDIFFAGLAEAFLGQTRGFLMYCGGDDKNIVVILDMNLYVAKKIAEAEKEDNSVHEAYFPKRVSVEENDFLVWIVNSLLTPKDKRRAELLQNPEYRAILDKYKK